MATDKVIKTKKTNSKHIQSNPINLYFSYLYPLVLHPNYFSVVNIIPNTNL